MLIIGDSAVINKWYIPFESILINEPDLFFHQCFKTYESSRMVMVDLSNILSYQKTHFANYVHYVKLIII